MTLHVLLVCAQYPTATRWGGIGTYTRHHARALRAAGATVRVLSGMAPDAPRHDNDGGIIVDRIIPTTGGDAGLDRRALCEALRRMADAGDVDVIEAPEYAAPLLDFQRSAPTVPVVIRLHGASTLIRRACRPAWRNLLSGLSAAARRAEAEERETVERASLVSATCQWTLDAIAQRGWNAGVAPLVVPNPLVPDHVGTMQREVPNEHTICILGRLDRVKGADLLPAIMRAVWAQRPDACFVSIGQDSPRTESESWRQWLVRMLPAERQSQVTFTGGVAPAAVARQLATQRIAVFASVFETSSYTLMECMSHGLACVVACAGGAREMGEHGTHLLLTQRSVASIADTLVQLLREPGTVDVLGMAARQHVRDVIASPDVARRVIAAYTQLAGVTNARMAA